MARELAGEPQNERDGQVMTDLKRQICAAVESGELVEPFDAKMIRTACPGRSEMDYHIFLTEHAVGVGNPIELIERVSFGLYRLNRCRQSTEQDAKNVD